MKVFKIRGVLSGGEALTLKGGIDMFGCEEPFHADLPLFFKPQLQQHSVI